PSSSALACAPSRSSTKNGLVCVDSARVTEPPTAPSELSPRLHATAETERAAMEAMARDLRAVVEKVNMWMIPLKLEGERKPGWMLRYCAVLLRMTSKPTASAMTKPMTICCQNEDTLSRFRPLRIPASSSAPTS